MKGLGQHLKGGKYAFPLFFLLGLWGCASVPYATVFLQSPDMQISLQVELATTPKQRQAGLQHRTHLAKEYGMLFIVKPPERINMWMKDTLIPLDVLFFDQEGRFINGHHMTPCQADPCKRYSSGALVSYVLEVNAGFLDQYPVDKGWQLEFESNNGVGDN